MTATCFLQIPNDEMYWVVTTVVSETRSEIRAKVIKHFIKVASKTHKHGRRGLCKIESMGSKLVSTRVDRKDWP